MLCGTGIGFLSGIWDLSLQPESLGLRLHQTQVYFGQDPLKINVPGWFWGQFSCHLGSAALKKRHSCFGFRQLEPNKALF